MFQQSSADIRDRRSENMSLLSRQDYLKVQNVGRYPESELEAFNGHDIAIGLAGDDDLLPVALRFDLIHV